MREKAHCTASMCAEDHKQSLFLWNPSSHPSATGTFLLIDAQGKGKALPWQPLQCKQPRSFFSAILGALQVWLRVPMALNMSLSSSHMYKLLGKLSHIASRALVQQPKPKQRTPASINWGTPPVAEKSAAQPAVQGTHRIGKPYKGKP